MFPGLDRYSLYADPALHLITAETGSTLDNLHDLYDLDGMYDLCDLYDLFDLYDPFEV